MSKVLSRFLTLKSRMATVVLTLVLLVTGVVAFSSLEIGEQKMRRVVGDQQFELLSSAADYIDEDIRSKQLLIRSLREEISVGRYRSAEDINRLFAVHQSLRGEFFNVIALDSTGILVASMNERKSAPNQSFANREYFTETIKNKEGIISKPFQSALSKQAVVLITEPIYDATGRLMFVLAGALDVKRPQFFGKLASLKIGETGYFFMMTQDGVVIHHPDQDRILKNVKTENGGALESTLSALSGFQGWKISVTKHDVLAIISYKQLRNTKWIIGSVYPVSEAFSPLIEVRRDAFLASVIGAIISGAVGWLAIMSLLKPLDVLQKNVSMISQGVGDISVFAVEKKDEIGDLSRAFYELSKKRRLAEDGLISLTRTDVLTGINNRRMFEASFDESLARSHRSGQFIALAFLDIDHFKLINDTHGHGVGDAVLVEFAARLKRVVRATDTVARLAGDEFVIVFEGLEYESEGPLLAEKILRAIHAQFEVGDLVLGVTTSIGIAIGNGQGVSLKDFMDASDAALYASKESGRNQYSVVKLACAVDVP